MTKSLPPSTDIEWLRKAAKALLKTWRAEGRNARLADAQFALAKEYEFPSWRAMKAFIDGMPLQEQADSFLASVGRGELAQIKSTLDQFPNLVNCSGCHPFWGGRPHPLHVAIDTNREDVFDLLIAAGADVEGKGASYDNWTPLMLALSRGRSGMIKTLTQHGAAENICTSLLRADDGALDRHLANENWCATALPSGSLIGLARTPHAVHELIKAGVSPDGQDRWGADAVETLSRLGTKGRPLIRAMAEHGLKPTPEIVARLGDASQLKALAKIDPSVFSNAQVIIAAVDFSHTALVRWLLENGADPNSRQDFGSGGTALHSAAWNGDLEMVRCLLDHGADTTALDSEHKTTPLVWAQTARTITNNPACDEITSVLARLAVDH